MPLTLAVGACVAVAAGTLSLLTRPRADAEQTDYAIHHVCVDYEGKLDANIVDGEWRPISVDLDLNGDGIPERIVFFRRWGKGSDDPDKSDRIFREDVGRFIEQASSPSPKRHSHPELFASALLILARQGKDWQPVVYYFEDEGGMTLTINQSPTTQLPFLCCDTDNRGRTWAWGASKRGGEVGPLVGVRTQYGISQPIERFMVRKAYPQ